MPCTPTGRLFEQTLLVMLYDEHGGFYDHVSPPAAVPPDDNTANFAFDQLGRAGAGGPDLTLA